MSNTSRRDDACAGETSLSGSALRGSFWISAQWLLNKAFAAGAMLLIAYFLSPDDYGVATTALAIAAFVWIMHPLPMGDVLIAYPKHFDLLVPTARRLALGAGAISTLATLIAIPVALRVYDTYPAAWLGGLLAALAISPLLAAVSVVPISNLRQKLEFRRIATLDGVLQLAATLLSVGLAAGGGRAAALVLPQILNQAARAVCYVRIGSIRSARRFHRGVALLLMRTYFMGAGAQYIHSVVTRLEIVVLGYLAGVYQTGLFGFAFILAVQANIIIAAQLGFVLQPILGKLQRDPSRQIDGFLRTLRVLGAVCVPFALLQVVLAEPFFRLLLPLKWQPAVPVFQVLSLMQAFCFALGPSMACLKAQRRFRLLLVWQGVQLILSLPAYWFGAQQGGAFGVAIASATIWSLSVPMAVWLCTKVDGFGRLREAMTVFVLPWFVGLPVFSLAYLLVQWLDGLGRMGNVVAIGIIGPMSFIAALLITRFLNPDFRSLADKALQWGWHRIRG